jgi:hypothetical protein
MLESIRGLNSWRCKDYIAIYWLWTWKIVKQDESDGDLKFTTTIGLGGKSASYWKTNIRQSWKCKGVCRAYRNPISNLMLNTQVLKIEERPMGHMSFLPQEVVRRKYGLGVFKEGIIIDDDLHRVRCNWLLT